MPHEDGPLYYPTIATVTLGSHTLLNFYDTPATAADVALVADGGSEDASAPPESNGNSAPKFRLLLEPNSLVILRGKLYYMLHGIAEVTEDTLIASEIANWNACGGTYADGQVLQRGTRVSLTIRHVTKTKTLKGLSFLTKKT